MPVFNTAPPPDLLGQIRGLQSRFTSEADESRRAGGSRLSSAIARVIGGNKLSPLDEIRVDQAAAEIAHRLAQVEDVRTRVADRVAAEVRRNDPTAQAQYAADVAGMDTPTGVQTYKALRGVRERPAIENDDDGNRMPDVTYALPAGTKPGQTEIFQRALATLQATRMATGPTNAEQLTHAGSHLQRQSLVDQAAAAPNAEAGNRAVAAAYGHLRTPFRTNEHGVTTNVETGVRDESGSLAQGNLELTRARTVAERAHAGERSAHAGLYTAQTDRVRKETSGADEGLPAQQFRSLTGAKLSEMPAEVRLQWMQNAAMGMAPQENLASLRQAQRRDALVNEARMAYESAYPKTIMGQRPTGAPDFLTFADAYVNEKEGGARVPRAAGGRPQPPGARETSGRIGGPASTPSQHARPRTQAEFDALPRGAVYIDPDDGRTYRKP